jgi:thiamine transport system permease protein
VGSTPRWLAWSWLVPATFLLVFLAYPIGVLGSHVWSGSGLARLVSSSTWHIVPLALAQATLSTAIAVVIGLPIANAVSRYDFRGRALSQALVTVPFVLPTVVVALAFRSLLGPGAPQGFALVVLAHAYVNLAVVVRIVGAQWSQQDGRLESVARTLGATRWTAFRTVTLPTLRPAIASSAAVVFIFSFTSLGIVLLLGDSSTRTLESQILRQTSVLLDFPGATASAIVQLVLVSAILAAGTVASRNAARRRMRPVSRPPLAGTGRWAVLVTAGFTCVIVIAPIAALTAASLRASGAWSLEWWTTIGSIDAGTSRIGSPLAALGTSLAFALICALVACVVGGLAAIAVLTRPTRHLLSHPRARHPARLRARAGRPAWIGAAGSDRALPRGRATGGRRRSTGVARHRRPPHVGRSVTRRSTHPGVPHRLWACAAGGDARRCRARLRGLTR